MMNDTTRNELIDRLKKAQDKLETPIDIVTIAYCGMSLGELYNHVEYYEAAVANGR